MTVAAIEGPDLLIVLVIVLVLFGGAKLPQLARSLGEAKREFERGVLRDDSASDSPSPGSTSAGLPTGSPARTTGDDLAR